MDDSLHSPRESVQRLRVQIPPSATAGELFQAVGAAQRFYTRNLQDQSHAEGLSHLLHDRQLPLDVIRNEGFGYVGEGWSSLVDHIHSLPDVTLEQCVEARLIDRSDKAIARAYERRVGRPPGSSEELTKFFSENLKDSPAYYYDYPRIRLADGSRAAGRFITIPVQVIDEGGESRVGGFQYRVARPKEEMHPSTPRYMSPRRSPVLVWNRSPMGFAESRDQLALSGSMIICEGKFDQVPVKVAQSHLPPDQRPAVVALGGLNIGVAARSVDSGIVDVGGLEVVSSFRDAGARRALLLLDEGGDNEARAILRLGAALAGVGIEVGVARISDAPRGDSPGAKDAGELYASHDGAQALSDVIEKGWRRSLAQYAGSLATTRLESWPHGFGGLWPRLQELDKYRGFIASLPHKDRTDAIAAIAQSLGFSEQVVEIAASGYDGAEPAGRQAPYRAKILR
jgi:hypothetical protein